MWSGWMRTFTIKSVVKMLSLLFVLFVLLFALSGCDFLGNSGDSNQIQIPPGYIYAYGEGTDKSELVAQDKAQNDALRRISEQISVKIDVQTILKDVLESASKNGVANQLYSTLLERTVKTTSELQFRDLDYKIVEKKKQGEQYYVKVIAIVAEEIVKQSYEVVIATTAAEALLENNMVYTAKAIMDKYRATIGKLNVSSDVMSRISKVFASIDGKVAEIEKKLSYINTAKVDSLSSFCPVLSEIVMLDSLAADLPSSAINLEKFRPFVNSIQLSLSGPDLVEVDEFVTISLNVNLPAPVVLKVIANDSFKLGDGKSKYITVQNGEAIVTGVVSGYSPKVEVSLGGLKSFYWAPGKVYPRGEYSGDELKFVADGSAVVTNDRIETYNKAIYKALLEVIKKARARVMVDVDSELMGVELNESIVDYLKGAIRYVVTKEYESNGVYYVTISTHVDRDKFVELYKSATTKLLKTIPPRMPTRLTAEAISSSEIKLTWQDNSSLEDGVRIERSVKGDIWIRVASVGPDVTQYVDASVEPDVLYRYRVKAYNSAGDSTYSEEVVISTMLPPRGLKVVGLSSSEVKLSWHDNSNNEKGFIVERSVDNNEWTKVAVTDVNVTEYVDSGVALESGYLYRVRAYNKDGYSSYSETIGVSIPSGPKDLVANVDAEGMVALTWRDTSKFESGFRVEWKGLNQLSSEWKEVGSTKANEKTFIDARKLNEGVYVYRVRAFNETAFSDYSNEATVVVLEAPSELRVVVNGKVVKLAWKDNSNLEEGFRIRRNDGISGWVEVGKVGYNKTEFSDIVPESEKGYSYRVVAFNGNFDSQQLQVNDIFVMRAPSNLSVQLVSPLAIRIAWADDSQFENGYVVERKTNEGAWTEVYRTAKNGSEYVDTKVSEEVLYAYRVAAFNNTGNSEYSEEASISILEPPYDVKAELLAGNKAKISWKSNFKLAEGFKVERKGPNGYWERIGNVKSDVRNFVDDEPLEADSPYYYRVKAYSKFGESRYSTESVIGLMAAPRDLVCQVVRPSQLKLLWKDSSDAELGFEIERRTQNSNWIALGKTGANETDFTDSDVQPDEVYYYRVRALANGYASGFSNEASGCILRSPDVFSAQILPSLNVMLSWMDNSKLAKTYVIERKVEGQSWVKVVELKSDARGFVDHIPNVENGKFYYRVKVRYDIFESEYSKEVFVDFGTLVSKLNVFGEDSTSVKVEWFWIDGRQIDGFRVERKGSEGFWVRVANLTGTDREFLDKDVAPEIEYVYRVRVLKDSSVIETLETTIAPLAAPSSLRSEVVDGQKVRLTWQDNSSYEEGYEVERRVASGTWQRVATVGKDVTEFVDDSPLSGEVYYRVRAFSTMAFSSYSNEILVKK